MGFMSGESPRAWPEAEVTQQVEERAWQPSHKRDLTTDETAWLRRLATTNAAKRHHKEMETMSNKIMDAFKADAAKVIQKMREVAEDEEAEGQGYNARMTPEKRAELRSGLRHIWDTLESSSLAGLKAWLDGQREVNLRAKVAAGDGLDPQARIATMMEADFLAKTVRADDLLNRAKTALSHEDAVGASVALRAAKLAAAGKALRGTSEVEMAVEKALDQHVDARRAAVEAGRVATVAYADGFTEVLKVRSEAMSLLGNAAPEGAAARASMGAKLAAREAAAAAKEQA